MAPCRAMICHQVTLSGDAEWPKVADAVIEAGSCLSAGFRHCCARPGGGAPLGLVRLSQPLEEGWMWQESLVSPGCPKRPGAPCGLSGTPAAPRFRPADWPHRG